MTWRRLWIRALHNKDWKRVLKMIDEPRHAKQCFEMHGNYAVWVAAACNEYKIVAKLLLIPGVDPWCKESKALRIASQRGYACVVASLLAVYSNIKQIAARNHLALHLALVNKHFIVFEAIVEHAYAKKYTRRQIAQFLFDRESSLGWLIQDKTVFKYLSDSGWLKSYCESLSFLIDQHTLDRDSISKWAQKFVFIFRHRFAFTCRDFVELRRKMLHVFYLPAHYPFFRSTVNNSTHLPYVLHNDKSCVEDYLTVKSTLSTLDQDWKNMKWRPEWHFFPMEKSKMIAFTACGYSFPTKQRDGYRRLFKNKISKRKVVYWHYSFVSRFSLAICSISNLPVLLQCEIFYHLCQPMSNCVPLHVAWKVFQSIENAKKSDDENRTVK